MAAQFQIDQVGLPTGVPGVSRTDGLATGAVVTLTNTGPGTTTAFVLFWIPPGDTTAVLSLAPTVDPKVWTFTPTAGVYGTYLVEMTEDAGEPSQVIERRILAVRTQNRALVVPAFNEGGDSDASLISSGPTQIAAADNNADDYTDPDLASVQYAASWRSFAEFISSLDDSSLALTGASPALVTKMTAAVGTADRAARADHKHDVASAAPANVTRSSAAEGVATSFSRSNHEHDVSTAVAGALAVGDAAAEGSASTLVRSDHTHSVAAGVPVDVTKNTAEVGVATSFSRGDHKHDISTAAPVAVAPFGSALSEGTSTALARADHVHTIPPSTGSANGYFSQTSITHGTVWTTAADIPEGNRFQFILTGAGGGGGSGTVFRGSTNSSFPGSAGAGGGARPPPYWWSRAYLISQLPITFTVPTGGLGGTSVARASNGNTAGNQGGAPAGTSIVGASGIIAFAGAGFGSSTGLDAAGGGCWACSVDGASLGGAPNDFRSGTGFEPDSWTFGGAFVNTRLNSANGTQTMSRHGGGGGADAENSQPQPTGGISQFGGGGGGGGGFANAFSTTFAQGSEGGGHDFTIYGGTTPATAGGGGGTSVLDGAGNPGPDGDENVAGAGGAGGSGHAVSSGNATAKAGGAGGYPGGGGGGGGSACSGSGTVTSGAGGKGGDAQILLTAYL